MNHSRKENVNIQGMSSRRGQPSDGSIQYGIEGEFL